MKIMKCDICESDFSESYYKNEKEEIICEDCLLELDGIETNTITQYFINGEFLGDDSEIDEVIDNICYALALEKVENNSKEEK